MLILGRVKWKDKPFWGGYENRIFDLDGCLVLTSKLWGPQKNWGVFSPIDLILGVCLILSIGIPMVISLLVFDVPIGIHIQKNIFKQLFGFIRSYQGSILGLWD